MKSGFHVCLYKRVGQPVISVYVQNNEGEICMTLDEFKDELIKEIGSVTFTLTRRRFEAQVDNAFSTVIRNIKAGVTHLM